MAGDLQDGGENSRHLSNQQEMQLENHQSPSNQRFNFFAFKEVDGAESSEADQDGGQSFDQENGYDKSSNCDSIPPRDSHKRDRKGSYESNSDSFDMNDPKLRAPKVTRSNKKPLKNAENSDTKNNDL